MMVRAGSTRVAGLGAVTAFGVGVRPLFDGLLAGRSGLRRSQGDAPSGRVPLEVPEARSRAVEFARLAAEEAAEEAGWTDEERSGALLVVATTKGALDRAERTGAVADRLLASFSAELAEALGHRGPRVTSSLACASGLAALGHAARSLDSGAADRAWVVAADAITQFVARGFASLGALDPAGARPFDRRRAGLSLGEGAAAVALDRRCRGLELAGYGASNDAHHLTGPARDGAGLVRALEAALAVAELPARSVGLGVLHGTATRYNDQMEGIAYARVFGPRAVPALSTKGAVGHAMAAAGLLNVVVAVRALESGVAPPSVGLVEPDPEIPLDLLLSPRPTSARWAVCSASGFGGVNAAVVLGEPRSVPAAPVRRPLPARLVSAVDLVPDRRSLASRLGSRGSRLDDFGLAVVAAADAALAEAGWSLPRAASVRHGLFLGSGLGCIEADLAFESGEGGPRRFSATLPSIALGEAAIRLQLHGEQHVVVAGRASGLGALAVAAAAVQDGVFDLAVVVVADMLGPCTVAALGAPIDGARPRAAGFVIERGSGSGLALITGRIDPAPRGRLARPARVDGGDERPGEPLGAAGLDSVLSGLGTAGRVRVTCPSGHAVELAWAPVEEQRCSR